MAGGCGMRNAECGMRNAECGMRNADEGIKAGFLRPVEWWRRQRSAAGCDGTSCRNWSFRKSDWGIGAPGWIPTGWKWIGRCSAWSRCWIHPEAEWSVSSSSGRSRIRFASGCPDPLRWIELGTTRSSWWPPESSPAESNCWIRSSWGIRAGGTCRCRHSSAPELLPAGSALECWCRRGWAPHCCRNFRNFQDFRNNWRLELRLCGIRKMEVKLEAELDCSEEGKEWPEDAFRFRMLSHR